MSKTLVVGQKDSVLMLGIDDCIVAMREMLEEISSGDVFMLQRQMIRHENGNALALMPATVGKYGITGSKVIIFPGPETAPKHTAQGIVPLFSIETGALEAIIDGESITVTRTAATSAAATDVLARKDASTLAILGAGKQGKAHAEAISRIRDIKKIFVWSLPLETVKPACDYLADKLGVEVVACDTAEDAVKDADIICTTTNARSPDPLLMGSWLKKGAHVNAVGACSHLNREVDTETVKISTVFVDQYEASFRDAGDLVIPMNEGAITKESIVAEVGEVILGKHPGRTSDDEITMFETVGLAVQDIAAAYIIYQNAKKNGVGVEVEI